MVDSWPQELLKYMKSRIWLMDRILHQVRWLKHYKCNSGIRDVYHLNDAAVRNKAPSILIIIAQYPFMCFHRVPCAGQNAWACISH